MTDCISQFVTFTALLLMGTLLPLPSGLLPKKSDSSQDYTNVTKASHCALLQVAEEVIDCLKEF